MSSKLRRSLAAALCLIMALGLLVPAGAAPAMLDEDYAETEVPVGETTADEAVVEEATVDEDVVDEDAVGAMPTLDHSDAVVDDLDDDESAELTSTANPYSHNFTTDGNTSTFYTISGSAVDLSTAGITLTGDYAQYTKGLLLETESISFTAPDDGTVTVALAHPSQTKGFKFITTPADGGKVTTEKPTMPANPCAYTHDVVKGNTYTLNKDGTKIHVLAIEFKGQHVHQWSDWTQTKAPSCTAEGEERRACSAADCPAPTETRAVDKIAHTSTNVAAKPATCVTDGVAAGTKCSVCGEILSGCTVIKATGQHDYGTDGTCKNCGVGQHTNHTWDSGTVTVAATCTKAGTRVLHCTVDKCEETKTETIPALGHDLTKNEAAKAPTCTEAGWDAYQACSRCDYTTKKTIPAKGHTVGSDGKTCTVCGKVVAKPLTNAGGWFETLYGVLPGVKDADVTAVSYSGAMNGSLQGEDLEYLVRDTADGVRVDIPGLTPGAYTLRVTAKGETYEARDIEVLEYDRSGFAHYQYTDGVGAYRDDGVLKENAIVLYVTEENKNTVTVTSADGTTVTGIGNILNSHGRDVGGGVNSKGGKPNSNQDILKKLAQDGTPLVVRFIGSVSSSHPNPTIDGVSAYDSEDYGGSAGDNGNMVRMKGAKDITIEGIGPDAVMDGWGMHFMCQSSDYALGLGKSFEVRNLAFRNVPEDCIGMEGIQTGSALTAPVERGWVHNCSFYAPSITPAAESDKTGGDGACDFKRGNYFTMDYCYYEGYHKTNLVGSSDSSLQYHITWHHNYWKDCESRGPLGRQANMHIYNCIYDGQTSYAMNPRATCYIFSEYNVFQNSKNPVQVKSGGVKSYQDVFTGCSGAQDATIVTDKTAKVSGTGNKYENFDTDGSVCYIPAGDYKLDKSVSAARQNILAYAGPMKAQIIKPDDVNTSVVDDSRVPSAPVALPYDQELTKDYANSAKSGTVDNIRFDLVGVDATSWKVGKTALGQDIIFKVAEAVDITVTDGGATVPICLVDASGVTLLSGSGTVKKLPAGTYFLQSGTIDPSKGTYKEAKVSHLIIVPTTDTTPEHVHSFTGWKQTKAPTCVVAGVEMGACSCGETETRPIAKLDHDYVGGACVMCGVLDGTFGGDPNAPEVPVDGLTLSAYEVTILQGKSERVIATVTPTNATNKAVTWTSADSDIVTVAKNGTIAAKGPGETTVTATVGSFTETVQVRVIAVTTTAYTFSATAEGPQGDMPAATQAVAAGSKWGTKQYFTNNGSGNNWQAKNYSGKKPDKTVGCLLLAQSAGSSLDFTVPAGSTAKVTLNFSSTSSSNTSAIAILDASGNMVGEMATVEGTGAKSATYELPAGAYKIVTPKDVQPGDVNDSWDAFPADANNPNKRGVRLISVSVEEETVASGDYVAVDAVTLDQTAATVEAGHSLTLTATVTPADATNKTVSWTTSNATVATVSSGVVTGRGVGAATITASAGSYKATCAVTVTPSTHEAVKVTSITVTDAQGKTSGAVTVDGMREQEIQLTRTVEPEDADNTSVTWTSDCADKGVRVNSNGLVTVSGEAETCAATITATAKDGSGVKGSYTLTVSVDSAKSVDVTGVRLNRETGSVAVGNTLKLTATVQPANATNKKVAWTSDDETVATVDQTGKVTAKAVGSATITVTTDEGDFTADCAVTVVAASSGGGGASASRPSVVTTPAPVPATLPFVDVPTNTWYVDSVQKVYSLGLMRGTDDTHFAPDATTTRAMVATVLFRLDGEKETNLDTVFDDVATGAWYEKAVEWAAQAGVVQGYDKDTFAPDDNVTREQLAVMLYRYAHPTAVDAEGLSNRFTDAASVSDWAKDAIAWAVASGVMNGKGGGILDPKGPATRAQICAMLMRFVELKK